MGQESRCIHCMQGVVLRGVCTSCGKPETEDAQRPINALPVRYLLGQKQYELGRVLGSGGYGITYLAWDQKGERRVAVKELFPAHAVRRGENGRDVVVTQGQQQYFQHVKQRFCEEAQALYRLKNVPEVIDVYRLFEENGTAYYVMEYLEGMDLKKHLLKNGRMSWGQITNPLCMILRALYALHGRNLIHRDISPDNIFMLNDGRVKLIDFGSARNYSDSKYMTTILKARFAPYEQFEANGKQGPWTDIYSLSVTVYYALSGILPPRATDRYIAWRMQSGAPDMVKPIRELCSDIPPNAAQALHKGMAPAASQRYPSIREFAEALFPGKNILTAGKPAVIDNRQRVGACMKCVDGIMAERQYSLQADMLVTVGRDSRCQLRYPPDSQGISRRHCSFIMDKRGKVYVRDEGSTYGTYLNGARLKPMAWYLVGSGSRISFAKETYSVICS